MEKFILVAMCFFLSLHAGADMFVSVPVASAWTDPDIDVRVEGYVLPLLDKDVPQHDTQLLYGEAVEVLEKKDSGWCKARLLEQPHVNRKTGAWGLCDAWMLESDLQAKGYDKSPRCVVTELWANVFKAPDLAGDVVKHLSFGTLVSLVEQQEETVKMRLLDGTVGYVRKADVAMLSDQAKSPNDAAMRQRLIGYTRKFLGLPYCWGGRSAYDEKIKAVPAGVDCSGLVSLVYRACGFNVPRNAHPQFAKATPVEPKDMQPGDLIFFKREKYNFERVNHVMIYIGKDAFIEATKDSKSVRLITAHKRLTKPLLELKNGMRVSGQGSLAGEIEIHCGSFFVDQTLAESLRIKS